MTRFLTSILTATMLFATTGISAQEMLSKTKISQEKKLSGLSSGDIASKFEYNSSNQLIKVESPATSITYDYNPVTVENEDYDMTVTISDPSANIVCYLSIGDNGFISKSYEMEETMGVQAHYKTYNFEYDSDGHLIKIDDSGFTGSTSTTFEYSNGNIISSSTTGDTTTEYSVAYTSKGGENVIENTAGLMDYTTFGFNGYEARYFYYAGLLGTPTADLPVKTTIRKGNDIATSSYMWNIDSEGMPTALNSYNNNIFTSSNEYTWRNTAGIADISAKRNSKSDGYYDINGVRHGSPTHGINIAIAQDGSMVKTINR